MSKKIGIIGHVGHGKTSLSAAISSVIANKGLSEPKTIDELIEEEKSLKITAPNEFLLTEWHHTKNRRERRAAERNSNKKRKL